MAYAETTYLDGACNRKSSMLLSENYSHEVAFDLLVQILTVQNESAYVSSLIAVAGDDNKHLPPCPHGRSLY